MVATRQQKENEERIINPTLKRKKSIKNITISGHNILLLDQSQVARTLITITKKREKKSSVVSLYCISLPFIILPKKNQNIRKERGVTLQYRINMHCKCGTMASMLTCHFNQSIYTNMYKKNMPQLNKNPLKHYSSHFQQYHLAKKGTETLYQTVQQ